MLDMKEVKSGNIASVGYNEGTNELHVKFNHSDSVYVYSGVPASVHANFMKSESKGRFLSSSIKGKFEFVKLN